MRPMWQRRTIATVKNRLCASLRYRFLKAPRKTSPPKETWLAQGRVVWSDEEDVEEEEEEEEEEHEE